jgi:hypothetical protein
MSESGTNKFSELFHEQETQIINLKQNFLAVLCYSLNLEKDLKANNACILNKMNGSILLYFFLKKSSGAVEEW